MTEKEIFSKLFDMSSAELHEMFDWDNVKDIINNVPYSVIITKLCEPRYGDVYLCDGIEQHKKAVFLGEDSSRYWLLFEGNNLPQTYTISNFKAWYIKTGENVADKLKGLFE